MTNRWINRCITTFFVLLGVYVLAWGLFIGMWTLVVSVPLLTVSVAAFVEVWINDV